jgi:hypothetical protein
VWGIDWDQERWHNGSREDLRAARAPGTSTTTCALGKFLMGHFGSLMTLVKASRD